MQFMNGAMDIWRLVIIMFHGAVRRGKQVFQPLLRTVLHSLVTIVKKVILRVCVLMAADSPIIKLRVASTLDLDNVKTREAYNAVMPGYRHAYRIKYNDKMFIIRLREFQTLDSCMVLGNSWDRVVGDRAAMFVFDSLPCLQEG